MLSISVTLKLLQFYNHLFVVALIVHAVVIGANQFKIQSNHKNLSIDLNVTVVYIDGHTLTA